MEFTYNNRKVMSCSISHIFDINSKCIKSCIRQNRQENFSSEQEEQNKETFFKSEMRFHFLKFYEDYRKRECI